MVEERTSNAAIWCQRLAVFLLPYFLLVVPLYRFNKVDTVQLFALIGIGLMIAMVAMILAIRAIVELWTTGCRGGSQAVRGSIIALLVLMPFLYFSFLAIQLPLANDVATNPFDPPDYVAAIEYRENRVPEGMNPVFEYTPEYAQEIVAAYPKLQSRRYPAGPERVLDAVTNIIRDNEWPLTASLGLPEPVAENEEQQADENSNQEALEDNVADAPDIILEFVERTLVLGFENDVVVRIVSEDQNTLVDVRSSSRWGRHDFGYNAKLIEDFLGQLDAALLGIAGEG